jgi:hypothetical protein
VSAIAYRAIAGEYAAAAAAAVDDDDDDGDGTLVLSADHKIPRIPAAPTAVLRWVLTPDNPRGFRRWIRALRLGASESGLLPSLIAY